METVEEKKQAEPEKKSYKFVAYPGNHPEAVREALHRRGNLTEVHATDTPEEKIFDQVNIIWRPVGYQRKLYALLEKANQSREPFDPLVN